MDILAFASFAMLVVAWLVAPNTTRDAVPVARDIEAPESVTAAA